jgi:N-dimethylarginine dimethylaminohydrolase
LCEDPHSPASEEDFAGFAYPQAVDHARTAEEHEAFCALLEQGGAEVVRAGPDDQGLLDAIFAYDPSLMTDAGAILLRPGKELRLPEVELAGTQLYRAGDPGPRANRGA